MKYLLAIVILIGCTATKCMPPKNPIHLEPKPTGGPCNYENVFVDAEVTSVYADHKYYRLLLTPQEEEWKSIFDHSYTDNKIVIVAAENDVMAEGDHFNAWVDVMTEGTCNPYPSSIKLEDGSYRDLASTNILIDPPTDLKEEYKK